MFDLISSLVEYNEEENIGNKIVCFLLSCKRTIKTPLRQRLMRFLLFDCTVPAVPQTRLNSACGTWDKIEICLRYRNRTLPWTLPPEPQVSLQLCGKQALQHLENTPEIKFECQEDKQLCNILELYFKIFQVRTIFFR